jgi:hypothetical protein
MQKLRRSSNSRQIGRKEKIWTVEESTSRRSSGGAYRRRRPTAVGSHREIPTVVRSGEVAHRVSLRRRSAQRKREIPESRGSTFQGSHIQRTVHVKSRFHDTR